MQPVPPRRPVSPVFGQLYVSAAVLAFAALFVPLWVLDVEELTSFVGGPADADGALPPLSSVSSTLGSYSLWRGIVVEGEGVAVVATLLILVLGALAVVAAHRRPSFLMIGALLVLGIVAIVMLLADPGKPSAAVTGPGAGMLWGAALVVVCTSAVQLFRATAAPRA